MIRIIKSQRTPDLRTAALMYAEGLTPVFPCKPGSKVPLVKGGFHAATTDPRRIEQWWSSYPDANIGIPTGEIPGFITYDVLDIDVRADGDGRRWLSALAEYGIADQAHAKVATPSSGFHWWFAASTNRKTSFRDAQVDYLGVGGYVIAPPSRYEGPAYSGDYRLLDQRSASAELDVGALRELFKCS